MGRNLPTGFRAELRRRALRMVRAATLEAGWPHSEASLLLTDDAEIQTFNRDFRAKDTPTDVLAFAQREAATAAHYPGLLGDVVISLPTAERQATSELADEVFTLWAHGLCHLLGYDHQTDDQEAEMNARAALLLAEGARTGRVTAT